MNSETRYIKINYPSQLVDDQVIILDPVEKNTHSLNSVAAFIWNSLENPMSIVDLTRKIESSFETEDQSSIQEDIIDIINKLQEQKLIKING